MAQDKASEKKEYSFGEYEVIDFETFITGFSPKLNNLAVYARIPAPPADCSDSMPADFCVAPY